MNSNSQSFLEVNDAIAFYLILKEEKPLLAEQLLKGYLDSLKNYLGAMHSKIIQTLHQPHLHPFHYDDDALLLFMCNLVNFESVTPTPKLYEKCHLAFGDCQAPHFQDLPVNYLSIHVPQHYSAPQGKVQWCYTLPKEQDITYFFPTTLNPDDIAAVRQSVREQALQAPRAFLEPDYSELTITYSDVVDIRTPLWAPQKYGLRPTMSLSMLLYDRATDTVLQRDLGASSYTQAVDKLTFSIPTTMRAELLAATFENSYLSIQLFWGACILIPMLNLPSYTTGSPIWAPGKHSTSIVGKYQHHKYSTEPEAFNLPVASDTLLEYATRFWWLSSESPQVQQAIIKNQLRFADGT